MTKFLDIFKFIALADNKLKVIKLTFGVWERLKHCWKIRKSCLPVFSSLSTMFFFTVVKTGDCVIKVLGTQSITNKQTNKQTNV